MWKLTSWGFRKCGSFWDLEVLNRSYGCSKSVDPISCPPKKLFFRQFFCRKLLLTAKPFTFDYIVLYIIGKLCSRAFTWYFLKKFTSILQSVRISGTYPDWSVTISLKHVINKHTCKYVMGGAHCAQKIYFRWYENIYFPGQTKIYFPQ